MAESLIATLVGADIEFVVVGGMAAVLHGAPVVTHDLDIVHRQTADNVLRLVNLLDALHAVMRDDPRNLKPPRDGFLGRGHILLRTDRGALDVLCRLGSGQDYDWLLPHTEPVAVDRYVVRVIDLPTLIQVKAETNRAKDRLMLPILTATLEERNRRP